jgi:hypothetical protein
MQTRFRCYINNGSIHCAFAGGMMAPKTLPGSSVTPLWIVAAFVSLTEVTLGYAITQTTSGVQIALTTFFISFALLVFISFIVILWNKPYVFYPPSEYGDKDPKHFVEAMKLVGSSPSTAIEYIENNSESTLEDETRFRIIGSLTDDLHHQLIILMHKEKVSLPYAGMMRGYVYELSWKSGRWSGGGLDIQKFANQLDGVELLKVDLARSTIHLTPLGESFADWLEKSGLMADYFDTPFGRWGEPTDGGDFVENFRKKMKDPNALRENMLFKSVDEPLSTDEGITK